MIRSLRTFAWLRDFVIAVLFIAGLDLLHTSLGLAIVLIMSALVVFLERAIWSWYLLDLRDQKNQDHA